MSPLSQAHIYFGIVRGVGNVNTLSIHYPRHHPSSQGALNQELNKHLAPRTEAHVPMQSDTELSQAIRNVQGASTSAVSPEEQCFHAQQRGRHSVEF